MRPLGRWLRVAAFTALMPALGTSGAGAEETVRLIPTHPVAYEVAAFPRLAAPPWDKATERINRALAAGDARVREAAEQCKDSDGKLAWRRAVDVPMRGPRYLTLRAADEWDCGAYPETSRIALVYDLESGAPVNWVRLLPKGWVTATTTDTAGDGTIIGAVTAPKLQAIYVALAKPDAIDPECKDVLAADLSFQLWPDAEAAGLAVEPVGLPHAATACGPAVVVPVAQLRREGMSAAWLDAIETAHQEGRFGLGSRG